MANLIKKIGFWHDVVIRYDYLWMNSRLLMRFLLWLFFPLVITHCALKTADGRISNLFSVWWWRKTGKTNRPYRCSFCGTPTYQAPVVNNKSFCSNEDCINKAFLGSQQEARLVQYDRK